ncbi:MAG TPA: dephospho-CoA kinase [Betaproteobacteria bacterium]|nr:dephospho-CoA kinase [Betaproteobacteria bacterium]
MPFAIGLTGGIGCGKSRVAEKFAQLGAAVIDTDKIAHALTAPGGEALGAIAAQFGDGYQQSDGSLDRAKLRRLIFADPDAKARLEALIHPLIRRRAAAEMAALTHAPYVMIVIPLLVETGQYQERIHRILVVDCDEARQISRTMARSGLTEAEVRAVMLHQASRATRLQHADDIVTNNGALKDMEAQVIQLHARYLALADKRREKMRTA